MAFPGRVADAGIEFILDGLPHLLDDGRETVEAVGVGNGVRAVERGIEDELVGAHAAAAGGGGQAAFRRGCKTDRGGAGGSHVAQV